MIITKYYVYICILYRDYVHRLYITFFTYTGAPKSQDKTYSTC